jgi:CHAT domain-containing protein
VVLSACHTSEGKATAEGLVNLARAFIIAGVPCVVASQWAVLDGFTSTLMKYFYYNLRHGQDVATSLRSAMSRMIDEECSVKAWAPFVVWGSSSLVLPEDLR